MSQIMPEKKLGFVKYAQEAQFSREKNKNADSLPNTYRNLSKEKEEFHMEIQ
jgi:hypothetical protein